MEACVSHLAKEMLSLIHSLRLNKLSARSHFLRQPFFKYLFSLEHIRKKRCYCSSVTLSYYSLHHSTMGVREISFVMEGGG